MNGENREGACAQRDVHPKKKRARVPIRRQALSLMLSICLAMLVALSGVCFVAYRQVIAYRQRQDIATIQSSLRQIAVSLREQLKWLDGLATGLLSWEGASGSGVAGISEADRELIRIYFRNSTDIAGLSLRTMQGQLIHQRNDYSPYTFYAYSDFETQQIFLELQSGNNDLLLRRKNVDSNNEYLQFIKRSYGEAGTAVVLIDQNTGPLKSSWQELRLQTEGNLRVLNSQNDILSSIRGNERRVDRLVLSAMDHSAGHLANVWMDGELQYIFYEKTVLYGCTILYSVPASYFDRIDASLLAFAAGIFLVGLASLVAVTLFYRHFILRPVSRLEKRISYLAQDRLRYEMDDVNAAGAVGKAFSRTMNQLASIAGKLNHLTESDISLRTLLKQAELDALQSQISPHFLYNTLETIRGQALTIGAGDIEKMTKSLSELFRYSIVNMGSRVSMQEELKNVDNYLSIQHFRFGDKFTASCAADADTLELRVPKLLIQPLVENAFQHGLEQKVGNGHISVRAYRTQQRLIIQVEDDGVGIPEKKRKQINDFLRSGKSIQLDQRNRIGLSNVNDRIKLNYGDEYGIQLYGIAGQGTLVEVELPLQQHE